MSTTNTVTLADRIITQTGEPAWDTPTVWYSESVEWLAGSIGYEAQVTAANLAAAQELIDTLIAGQATLATQMADDIASVTSTGWDSLTAADRNAIVLRMLNGFGTAMQAITAHLIVTRHAPSATPLS